MDSRLNYTIVGVFMAVLLVGLLAFVYWLGKNSGNQQYDYYHVYMTESVSGLSTDASVKYMGVDVGTVMHVDINPTNSEQVELLLQIRQGIPVKVDTKASLRFYGVTGLAFIELMGGGKNSPLLTASKKDEIPVIVAAASTFSNIEKTLNDLAANSATVLEKIDRLLSSDNLKKVDEILIETQALVVDFRKQQPHIASLIQNGIVAEKSIDDAFKKIALAAESVAMMTDGLVENGKVIQTDFSQTLTEIELASQSIKNMADDLRINYADVGQNISDEVTQSLTAFRQLLYQMDILVVDLQQTARTIEAGPADLLFKRSQPKLGPGEERHGQK